MTTNDGGPAFPEPVTIAPSGDVYPSYSGMSLRDWFAGQVLCGLLSLPELTGSNENFAAWAYNYADAMLAARQKGGGTNDR